MFEHRSIGGLCLGLLLVWPAGTSSQAADSTGPEATLPPLAADRDFHLYDAQLSWLTAALLENNPRIRAAREQWGSERSRVARAGALPDPWLSYRYFIDTPETRVGPQVQGVEITQQLPWAGARDLGRQRTTHLANGVEWQVRQLARSLVGELKRAYFDAAYLQEALAVNADETELLRRFEKSALTRYATGEGIQQSVLQVQTEISRLFDRETSLRRQLATQLRHIAHLIGRPDADLDIDAIALRLPELRYDREELEREAMGEHPSVRAVAERIEADQVWSQSRRLEGRPDFRLGVGYTDVGRREDPAGVLVPPTDNGKDIFSVSIGVSIPLFREKIRGGIAEAEQSVQAGRSTLATVRNRLRYRIQEATLRLESLAERARFYAEVIIPQAEQSLASAESAYTTNRQDFLDLLEAERVLFQVRLTHQRLLADAWIALAEVEVELGRKFPQHEADHG